MASLEAEISDSPADAPLLDEDNDATPKPPTKRHELTYYDGLAIVAGLQIGSGIFSAPAVVGADVQSAPVAVLVWLAAGLLVWTGAASFIELGTRIPMNGGMQQYLRLCLGDSFGFLFAWTWILVVKPTSTAMISTIFSEYLCGIVAPPEGNNADQSPWLIKAIALLALIAMTGLNCAGARLGTRSAHGFLVLKVIGLVSIGVFGLIYAVRPIRKPPALVVRDAQTLWQVVGSTSDAMFAALFAYGGWECIGFVAGEIHDPVKTLPKILHRSMALVLTLFLMACTTLYAIVPLTAMTTDAITVTFGRLVFGESGAVFYSIAVCIACLGSLNATIIAVGRLTEAASQQQYIPRFIGLSDPVKHNLSIDLGSTQSAQPRHKGSQDLDLQNVPESPIRAMLANCALGAIFIITGSFRGLLNFKGIVEYIGYLWTVIGLIRLQHGRVADPVLTPATYYHTPRVLPVLFALTSTFLIIRSSIKHPLQLLAILGFWTTGLLLRNSRWWQKLVTPREPR